MRGYLFFAAFLAALAYRVSHLANAFIRPELPTEWFAGGHASEDCKTVRSADNELRFCEDLTFWDFTDAAGNLVDRKVIASCDPGRKEWNAVAGALRDGVKIQGNLWLIDTDGDGERVTKLALEGYPVTKVFHPLGIRVWPSQDGASSNMFVVNDGIYRTTIEQFVLDPKAPSKAQYKRTIRSRYFVSPNALALTSPTSFFVSNDHLLTRRLPSFLGDMLHLFETFSGLPLGFISHVSILKEDSEAAVIRHTIPKFGFPFPNGIALSPDKLTLAVASSSYMRVQFFDRRMDANGTESLTHSHTVSLPFAPDNIHGADDDSFVIAGHPFFPSLIAAAEGKSGFEDSPPQSWVVSLPAGRKEEGATASPEERAPYPAYRRVGASASGGMQTLYQGDGTKFGGSTTGLIDSRTGSLFVAGLVQEGLLICRPLQ